MTSSGCSRYRLICSSKQASRRYDFFFPIILGGSKLTWKEICKLRMTFSGRSEVVVSIDDIVPSHGRHMLHVMSNPSLIFDKSRSGLGLDLGCSFEDLLMSAVVQIDFPICCSHNDSPPFLGIISEVDTRSNLAVTTCYVVRFGCQQLDCVQPAH